MAWKLKNYYCEPVSEHYPSVQVNQMLTYHHFVFERGKHSLERHFPIVCDIIARLRESDELVVLDYHYSLRRAELMKLCDHIGIKYHISSDGRVLSVELADPMWLMQFVPVLRNEDNLFLRFVTKTTTNVVAQLGISESLEVMYVQLVGAGVRKVAFLSLNPIDLEVVLSDSLPQSLLIEVS